MLSRIREPFNGLSHLGGAIMAMIGQIALLAASWPVVTKVVSVLIYGTSLVLMFVASGTYHSARVRPEIQAKLRRLDHSSIFLLIAGTYTPFCLVSFTGFFRWGLLMIIWAIAIAGICLKLMIPTMPRWSNALIYVAMGWLCVSAVKQMTVSLTSWGIFWLITGGVIYTLGAVVYATKLFDFAPGRFGFHEVWHLFVLFGAMAHFAGVTTVILHGG